jgi:thiol-disulfide isomerase/thioredoxin
MARPAAFTGLAFDAAIERSRASSSILIVDAMATWCGPCRQMDATTWSDSTVIERLMSGGSFAIQIDVDEEEETAARLEVRSMPTLIAFASGVEHDRIVGGRGPTELLEWLDILERGERYEDAQRAKRVAREALRARAAGHLAAQRHDDALADYTTLWTERRDPDLVDPMHELATAHAPAGAAFGALRETPAAGAPLEDVLAWIALNRIVDDEDATLAWYAANAVELPATRAVAVLVEITIVPLMMRRGRWVDAGVALADPRAALLRLVEARPPDLRGDLANIARALYAAGRDERASDFEFEAEAVDASAEMTAALAAAKAQGREDRAKR